MDHNHTFPFGFQRHLLRQGDGEPTNKELAARQLAHFDHTFKITLLTLSGAQLVEAFGVCKDARRPALLTCMASCFDISEEQGLSQKMNYRINYTEVSSLFVHYNH